MEKNLFGQKVPAMGREEEGARLRREGVGVCVWAVEGGGGGVVCACGVCVWVGLVCVCVGWVCCVCVGWVGLCVCGCVYGVYGVWFISKIFLR